ncbi:uncharacterized protein ACA1_249130 [Acanthamoeba castellanii str. Neff]|uniref:Uncharacterized protein n=1 Tax=Acanthamoeba castellanii (strain ATCC 30010 / Neff) TaxID=1257118 RepID=L8GY37_ACACF|nr:uncharacterized protein ACA1_249130 [Acanthamoeba castellanii str. Neff]ELR17867.1 hypothetical protein ACA1_249130 [Acanthamoeba castellanii str. Neff]
MHAREDAGTMLELTVTEFTVSGRRVLTVGQDVAVHSHGEVAEVRLRPLAGFVVEPFDVCPHLGRVLIRDTVTLAFGKVVRVARRYKSTFLDLLRNLEALRAAVEKESACLLGRDEHNNTLLHLLIGGRYEGVGMVVQQVEGRFGRVAAQKLMRVRNIRGETAIHLALGCGWFEVAALLLSLGAPLVPSKQEQARLSKLWKKPIPSPIDILDRRFRRAHSSRAVAQAEERRSRSTTHAAGIQRSPLNLALLCLVVLTRDRDDFTNLEDMLPTQAMQELFAIALCSLSSRQ